MKNNAREWARRGLAFLLSLSMAGGGVPASAYAEALMPEAEVQAATVEDETPAMPAFSGEATVDGVTVYVNADEGAFPEGVRLEASKVSAEEQDAAVAAAEETLPDDKYVSTSVVLDVRVVDADGNEVEPVEGSNVEVSFKAARVADEATEASIFHIQDSGEATELDATVDGDVISAPTDGFSTYVVTFTSNLGSYTINWNNMPVKVPMSTLVAQFRSDSSEQLYQIESVDSGMVVTAGADDYNLEIPSYFTGEKVLTYTTRIGTESPIRYRVGITLEETTKDLTAAVITLQNATGLEYNGQEQKPGVASVKLGGVDVPADAYTVSYDNNVNAGNAAKVIVTARPDGAYKGSASTNFTINPKTVTPIATFTAGDKVYDGTKAAPIASISGEALEGVVDADAGNVGVSIKSIEFSDANVGSNKTVTANLELTGTLKDNYTLRGALTTTASITRAPVKVTANDESIVVGDPEPVYTATVTGLVNGESEDLIDYTITCAHQQTAGIYDITPAGEAEQGNYQVTFVKGKLTISADLAQATVTVADQTYTGSQIRPTEITVTLGGANLRSGTDYDISGYGDNLQVGPGTVTIVGKGAYAGTVAEGRFNILPKEVKVNGILAQDKVYDGTTEATLNTAGALFEGKADADALTVSATGTFEDANAGTKAVNLTNLTLGGAAAGNYTVSADSQSSTTATITPAPIDSATVTAPDQTYTGDELEPTPTVTLGGKTLTADDFEVASYANNINAGTAEVTIRGKGNYAGEATGTFAINKAKIWVVGITAVDKQYDGTNVAQLDFSAAKVQDVMGDPMDGYTVTATGTFADPKVEDDKTVTISNIAITGSELANYELMETTATDTASITPKAITYSGITAEDKVEDGTTDATLDTSNVTFDGVIPGETVGLEVSGAFADAAVGANKVVNLTFGGFTGAYAGNYVLAASGYQTTARASILAKALPVVHVEGITAKDKTYNGNAIAELVLTGAKVLDENGDEVDGVTVASANGAFVNETGNADPNAGEGKTVAISSIKLSSQEYVLDTEASQATTTATIERVELTVTASDKQKIYGNPDPVLEVTIDGDLVEGDTIAYNKYRDAGENVGDYAIHVEAQEIQGNYEVTTKDGTFTIGKRAVTVTGIKANDKVYDGTVAATFSYDDLKLDGIVPNDGLSAVATGSFENKNVGNDVNVPITITLTGSAKDNYVLSLTGNQESTSANITAAPVVVSGITAKNKVYDGTTDAELVFDEVTFAGIVAGDTLEATAKGTFDTKNVGEIKLVRISDLALAGDAASNYVLADAGQQSTTTATITPKSVLVTGLKAESKTYDGTTTATINVNDAVIDGVEDGDDVSVISAKGTFANASPYTDIAVTLTPGAIQLGGADAGNYIPSGESYTPNPPLSAAIESAAATLTIDSKTKVYGDTDPEFTYSFSDAELYDIINVTLAREEGDAVGAYKILVNSVEGGEVVTLSGGTQRITKDGYVVMVNAGVLTINRKQATVTPIAASKMYGEDDPTLEARVSGLINDDQITYEVTREDGETIGTYAMRASGDEIQGNYTVAYVNDPPVYFTINPTRIVVSGIKGVDKVYDKTTAAELDLSGVVLDGLKAGDDVKLEAIGEFENENAGLNKVVDIYGLTLVGADAGNYEIDYFESQDETKASITRKEVTVKAIPASKTYGEVDPKFEIEEIEGLIYGDAVHYDLNRDEGEDVGTYKIRATGEEVQPNYQVTFVDADFTINQRRLRVKSGIKAKDKVYDSTTVAELDCTEVEFQNLVAGDEVIVSATGTFEDKNVGQDKTVTISDIKLSGAKAANYKLVDDNQTETKASITAASVKVGGITANDKVYDGTTTAELNVDDATFETLFGEDEVTVESATGTFDTKHVGEDKTVSISQIVLGGTDADNYVVNPAEGVQTTTTATITPKEVIVDNIGTEDKDYDKTNVATLVVTDATIDGLVADDEGKVIVKAATGHFSDANAGKGKSVVIDTVTFGPAEGADEDVSGNYVAKLPESHAKEAEIRALKITVTADDKTKVYGEQNPELTYTIDPGIPEGETLDINIKCEVGQDAGEYAISFDNPQKWLAGGNYEVEYVDGTFAITSRPVTVTPVDNSKIYGEDDPELTAEVTSELDSALVGADELVYTVKRVEGQDAGTYDITVEGEELQGGASNKNYKVTYAGPATFTINPKEVTVTAASFTKKYGEADPEFTATVDPEMPNGETIQYKLDRVKGEDGGQSYAIFFVDNPEYQSGKSDSDAKNYHITYVTGTLAIDRLKVTVKADNKAKAYGDVDPELTATIEGVTKGETITYTIRREEGEEPAEYKIIPSGEAIQGSYEVTYVEGTFAIGEKVVYVTANDLTKVYGEDDPEFTATVEGVVGTDTIEFELSREDGEDVGTYAIKAEGEASQYDGKYAVVFTNGELTITPKVVTVDGIATDPEGRVYDGTTNVELVTDDAQVHDLAFEDELTVVATGHFVDKHAGDDKDVLIDSIELTGEKAKNYQLDVAKSQKMTTGKVNRKPVTIKPAVNITKVYGESDPEEIRIAKDVTVEGLLNGDNLAYLPTALTREAGEQVGEYDVKFFVQPFQGDYVVTCEPGTLTITPRPIKITNIAAKDKVYDSTVAAELDLSKIKVENLVTDVPFRDRLEEGRLEVSATAEFESKDAADGKTVNITGITLTGDIAHNYVVDGESQATATASIFKAPVKVDGIKADDKVYDATTDATLDVSEATFETLFEGDEVTVESATGTFDTKNVVVDEEGNCVAKTVYVSEIKLAGTDGGNYYVLETEDEEDPDGTQAIASATITPFQVIVKDVKVAEATKPDGTTGRGKVYDKTTDVDLDWSNATIHTLYDIDEGKVDVAKVEGYYNDPDAGTGKMVTLKTVTLSGEEAINYTAVPDPEPHTFGDIWRKPVTVTANDLSKVYGETDPELTATLDPAPMEGDTISYTILRKDGEDAGEYEIYFDNPQAQQDNYQVTFVKGTFTIESRPITVTANGAYKIYGEADPELTAKVTSEMDPALVGDDTIDYTLKREEGEDYGVYAIQFDNPKTLQGGVNDKNYTITFVDGEFAIYTRAITIRVNDYSKLYGEADPEFDVTITSDMEGTTGPAVVAGDEIKYTIDRTRNVYEGDGGQTYSIPIHGDSFQAGHKFEDGHKLGHEMNYHITYEEGTLTVNRRNVTVTANNASIVYGEKDPAFTATVTGTTKGDTVTYTFSREAGSNVGSYKVTPKGEKIQGSYIVTYKPGTLTIKPKAITVTPKNLSKVYGSKDPALTANVVGLVGKDSVKYTISRAKGENVGKYAITATGAATQGNYKVTFKAGTFTITPKKVKISAKNLSKVYGTKDPTLTATTTGLIGKDTVKFSLVRQTGEDAGKYAIRPSGKATQGNYQVEFVGGTFTITRRKVTVTPVNASKYYSRKDPALKAKVTGTTKGETVTYTLKRAKGEKVGTYKITASGKALQGNYEITYKTGKFKISDVPTLTTEYSAHMMSFGWSPAMYDGDFAGTTGQRRRIEAITVKIPNAPYKGGITYRASVESKGWSSWAKDGALAGTWGKKKQAEAFQIKLYGELAKHYDVYYRAHTMTLGWMAWAKNGQTAGTTGQGRRAEAIQVIVIKKGSPAPAPDYKGVAQMYNKASV